MTLLIAARQCHLPIERMPIQGSQDLGSVLEHPFWGI